MEKSEWYDVLKPREAVIAGIVGLAIAWPLGFYLSNAGYVIWGYTPKQWKDAGTAVIVLSFAVPYWLVKWWVKRR